MEASPERTAYSVPDFCKKYGISRALFYKSLKDGWGPETMKFGSRRVISFEADDRFRRRMEAASAADQTRGEVHDHCPANDEHEPGS